MNRIEEIKEKYNPENVVPLNNEWETINNQWKDIQYLLSKLEIAEKALEKIEQDAAASWASWIAGEATKALQQIRE